MARQEELMVGMGGLGAIGLRVARVLDQGIPGLRLAAASERDEEKATKVAGFAKPVPVVALADLPKTCEVVVECLPAAAFEEIAYATIRAGRTFVACSVGQLVARMDLVDEAERHGARIIVPTGALLGLDAVRAAAEGTLNSVTIVTRKPPKSLVGAPHLIENNISINNLTGPILVFDGSARDAIKGFPANVNVSSALSLAGIGPDRTEVQVWADPALERNTHTIKVDSDTARFTMTIEGIPTEDNPATGKLTPLSVISTLRGLVSTLRVGS